MRPLHGLSSLPLCLSLYLLLFGREGLNVMIRIRENREGGCRTAGGGGRLFTLLSVTLLWLLWFPKAAVSRHLFLNDRCH